MADATNKNPLNAKHAAHWTWILWALFAIAAIIARFDAEPTAGNVFNIYREAANRWLAGQALYPPDLYFNYFPQSAIFFIPWTWLAFDVGGAIWRALNLGVFAVGIWQLVSACGLSTSIRKPGAHFLVASLVAIALSWSAARYGQMTLAMAGLMMLAAADLQRGTLWRAALFACLAVALKPPAIVLLLVVVAIYPRLLLPITGFLGLLFVLPFATQAPDYVLSQYLAIPEMLQHRVAKIWYYPHLTGLLDSLGWTVDGVQKTALRAVIALFVLATCWRVKFTWQRPGLAFYLYALTACYILLLGEGTEHNTYAMMGPAIGFLAGYFWLSGQRLHFSAMVFLTLATLSSRTLLKSFPDTVVFSMAKPMVCLVLVIFVSWLAWNPALREHVQPARN